MPHAFYPGREWLDTSGKPIQAHGGSILTVDGIYYWYGENKEKTDGKNGIWHWGVRCYRSRDLYNWEDCGLIIPPDETDEQSPLHPASMMDRPHILYNARTKKYVCWLKIMEKKRRADRNGTDRGRSAGTVYHRLQGAASAGHERGGF